MCLIVATKIDSEKYYCYLQNIRYIIIFNEIRNDSLFIQHALAFLDLLFIRPLLSSVPSIICTVY